MSNRNYNKKGISARGKRPQYFSKEIKSAQIKKKPKGVISGFSTLNEVTGVPTSLYKPSSLSSMDESPKVLIEPSNLVCSICGQPISNITTAFVGNDDGYVHFDCVLDQMKEYFQPTGQQLVSYLGVGKFGLCEVGEDGKYHILSTLAYEDQNKQKQIKQFIESLKK